MTPHLLQVYFPGTEGLASRWLVPLTNSTFDVLLHLSLLRSISNSSFFIRDGDVGVFNLFRCCIGWDERELAKALGLLISFDLKTGSLIKVHVFGLPRSAGNSRSISSRTASICANIRSSWSQIGSHQVYRMHSCQSSIVRSLSKCQESKKLQKVLTTLVLSAPPIRLI